jgi:RNA polymerase sigma-70 factor (ECF subfamily)
MGIRPRRDGKESPAIESTRPPAGGSGRFPTTSWSLVAAAGKKATPSSRQALEILCQRYWKPVYVYVRRRGYPADEARDLTQGFFERLLTKNDLFSVTPERGRFRSWLLTCVRNYLANEWDHARTKARGGGVAPLSIDAMTAEERYRLAPSDTSTPERLFERHWALTLMERALDALRTEHEERGVLSRFEALKMFLEGDSSGPPYKEVADALGMTEGNVKVAVHRLRRRYGELLRAEIAQTIERAEDIEGEIHHFFQSFD